MQKVESLASQAKDAAKGAAEHIQTQVGVRRETLFDMSERVALITGMSFSKHTSSPQSGSYNDRY